MMNDLEHRRQIALAQLDVFIDVASAWRGRYEDDDMPATIAWITAVIPHLSDDPQRGWLCVSGTATPGIGWEIRSGAFRLAALHGTKGLSWPLTRKQFRSAARESGVGLPSRHATIYTVDRGGLPVVK